MYNPNSSASPRAKCRNCGREIILPTPGFPTHLHNGSRWCTYSEGTQAEPDESTLEFP